MSPKIHGRRRIWVEPRGDGSVTVHFWWESPGFAGRFQEERRTVTPGQTLNIAWEEVAVVEDPMPRIDGLPEPTVRWGQQ